jgi:DNA-binding LacI/PurR family transcriptional regulator
MRTLAYMEALEKNGISFNPLYLHQVKVTDTSFAYEAVLYLLKLPKRPTAIVASNNIIGQGCLKALHSSKISVPDDISFIVFDKISGYDLINPTITCITQPIEFIGKNAASFLLERIKGEINGFQKAIVMPELVFGNSCKILDI